jgi:hypothetical protein
LGFGAHDAFRERKNNSTSNDPQPSALRAYMEEEPGTQDRLSQGPKLLNEKGYVEELKKKIDKLEKVIEGENGVNCSETKRRSV